MKTEASPSAVTPRVYSEGVQSRSPNLYRSVLLVEHEKQTRELICQSFRTHGLSIFTATCSGAEQAWLLSRPDLVIVDCSIPDGQSLRLIARLKQLDPAVRILVLTGYASLDRAAQAMKLGAEQFFTKPVDLAVLRSVVQRELIDQRNQRLRHCPQVGSSEDLWNPFLGESDIIRKLAQNVQGIANQNTPVLIEGELGTGKRSLAEWLHRRSLRKSEPFIRLNCAIDRDELEAQLFGDTSRVSGTTSYFKLAHRGTLFLYNFEHADINVQLRLLEAIAPTGRIPATQSQLNHDVRLIVATSVPSAKLVAQKTFHGALYAEIGKTLVVTPVLRDRKEDIPALAREVLDRFARETGKNTLKLSQGATAELQGYAWPGNLRELRIVLERAALLSIGNMVTESALQLNKEDSLYTHQTQNSRTLQEWQRKYIEQVFRAEGGRVDAAAKKLGMPRSSLYHKLKQYQIDRFGGDGASEIQAVINISEGLEMPATRRANSVEN